MILLSLLLLGAPHWKVCIDPGHPSEIGEGTRGKHITEIHAAWIIAKGLKAKLTELGCEVTLTKDSEKTFVRNRARAEVANEFHADLMVRLHCDSSAKSGYAIYYPDRRGKAEGVSGPSASVLKACKRVAVPFHKVFKSTIGNSLVDQGLLPDIKTSVGSSRGTLIGSVFSKVPVVLIEMVTLTNKHDEAFILSEKGQAKMVDALAKATIAGLEANSP